MRSEEDSFRLARCDRSEEESVEMTSLTVRNPTKESHEPEGECVAIVPRFSLAGLVARVACRREVAMRWRPHAGVGRNPGLPLFNRFRKNRSTLKETDTRARFLWRAHFAGEESQSSEPDFPTFWMAALEMREVATPVVPVYPRLSHGGSLLAVGPYSAIGTIYLRGSLLIGFGCGSRGFPLEP